MTLRPPRSPRTATLFLDTTLVRSHGLNRFTVIKITCKQNNAAHQWIAQALTLMVSQYRTFHIHHHRAGRQALARSAVCHRLASVKFLGAKSSASTTTKAATVSVSSVTEIWALPKRSDRKCTRLNYSH